MTSNPFETPSPIKQTFEPNAGRSVSAKAPSGIMAVCIICIILGGMGLLGSCFGAGGLIFQKQIQGMQQNVGDAAQQEMQKELAAMQDGFFVMNAVVIGVNFIVAPLLLMGGIFVLTRKNLGVSLLKIGLPMAAFYMIIKTALGCYMQMQMMDPMKAAMRAQGNGQNAEAARAAEGFITGAMYVGVAFSVMWALVLIAFYLWARLYLNRPAPQAFISTFR